MRFAYPWVLTLLALLPILAWVRWRFYRQPTLMFSTLTPFQSLASHAAIWSLRISYALRILAFAILIIALARPQHVSLRQEHNTQGIDIMLVFDVSESMAAEDFQPKDRLTVAKSVLSDFVQQRQGDRMGLVVFGDYALTQCPLTMDQAILLRQIETISLAMAGGRTAIGMGIAAGLNRLDNSKTKSQIIILLTDGVNTMGDIGPVQAAGLARDLGVKVYTIGVGKEGGAPIPIQHPTLGRTYARNPDGSVYMTEIDEAPLKEVAMITGGKYFRAHDSKSLAKIYDEINQLEKTTLKSSQKLEIKEHFLLFLLIGLSLLGLEWGLRLVIGRIRI